MPTRRSTLRIGRLAGIPIGIQPLWLVIVGVITFVLGHDYFPTEVPGLSSGAAYVLGLASALALFAGILLHELGHAVVARGRGVEVDEIDLWLLGGVARLHGEPRRPDDELRFALAGPAVTAGLLAVAVALRLAAGGVLPEWGRAALDYQVYVNALILGFNLLPAFPLDGGRVARALLWRHSGDRERATDRAASIGRAFGIGLIAFGVLAFAAGALGGLWLAFIGGFLIVAGKAEAQQLHVERAFGGAAVGDLMSAPAETVPASATLEDAVTTGFTAHLFSAFPVVDEAGKAVGILALDDVRAVPATHRQTTRVAEVVTPDPGLLVGPQTLVTDLLQLLEFHRVGRAVAVDAAGHPVGLISITDVQRRLRADALRPADPATPVRAA